MQTFRYHLRERIMSGWLSCMSNFLIKTSFLRQLLAHKPAFACEFSESWLSDCLIMFYNLLLFIIRSLCYIMAGLGNNKKLKRGKFNFPCQFVMQVNHNITTLLLKSSLTLNPYPEVSQKAQTSFFPKNYVVRLGC